MTNSTRPDFREHLKPEEVACGCGCAHEHCCCCCGCARQQHSEGYYRRWPSAVAIVFALLAIFFLWFPGVDLILAILALAFGIAGARTQDKVAGVTAIVIGSINIFLSIIYSLMISVLVWLVTDADSFSEPLETLGIQSVVESNYDDDWFWEDDAEFEDTHECGCQQAHTAHPHHHFDDAQENVTAPCAQMNDTDGMAPKVSSCVYATEQPAPSIAEDGSQITWHLVGGDDASMSNSEQMSFFQAGPGEFVVPLQTPFM